MKYTYDSKWDILTIPLKHKGKYSHSKKITDQIIVDVTASGKPISIEILDASEIISSFNTKEAKSAPHMPNYANS